MSKEPEGVRTVNINEWFKQRHERHVYKRPEVKLPTPDEIEAAKEQQAVLADRFAELHAARVLADRLEGGPRECSNCGQTERFYKEDYVCYQCRDRLDA
jgi:hypothetical protein